MIVFILIALIGFVIFAGILNIALYAVSYWIAALFAEFFKQDKARILALSQTTLLSIATIIIFVYSYKGCTYVDRFGSDDNVPAIGGWFLLVTGIVTVCITFYCLGEWASASEKQTKEEASAESSKLRHKMNVERQEKFIETSNLFLDSADYNLVAQFAKKFGKKSVSSEISKLQGLLETRGWEFDNSQVTTLVTTEADIQLLDNSRAKILSSSPSTRLDLMEGFLNHFQVGDKDALKALADILQERHLLYRGLDELAAELKTVHREIELRIFEKRLSHESEQIPIEVIDGLSGYEFENLLKELFGKMGFVVEQTKLSGDQGADLVIAKFGEKTVIQAKRFGGKVGNYAVQEIMAAISLYAAQKGTVITNNYFTAAAKQLAKANNINLIDRDGLEELINKHW